MSGSDETTLNADLTDEDYGRRNGNSRYASTRVCVTTERTPSLMTIQCTMGIYPFMFSALKVSLFVELQQDLDIDLNSGFRADRRRVDQSMLLPSMVRPSPLTR